MKRQKDEGMYVNAVTLSVILSQILLNRYVTGKMTKHTLAGVILVIGMLLKPFRLKVFMFR